MELVHSGKVRELYADGDDIIMVASDRVSVYDVVLPTPIPGKGEVLTQLSLWWFGQLSDVIPNHVISGTDVPGQWAGRAIRCRRGGCSRWSALPAATWPGSGWRPITKPARSAACGCRLASARAPRLPEPVFTPTTKAATGHDEPMNAAEVAALVGEPLAAELERATLEVYRRGAELAASRGIVIADTKVEFGLRPDGTLMLADELLTPDSSRFWLAEEWQPGRPQRSLDKQFLRDWSAGLDWDRRPPGPPIPPDVVAATQARYEELYARITARE